MSGNEPRGTAKKSHWTTYFWVALIATVAGFVAVYVNFGSNGNVVPKVERPATSAGAARPPVVPVESGPFAGLNRGAMATFLVHKAPRQLPQFTFQDGAGAPQGLDRWKGKVVLLNLWATWCAPCRKEMPSLDRLKAQLGGGDFDVVAISVDRGGIDKPRAFLEKTGASHLALYHDSSGGLGTRLKAFGMPTTLLINREGEEIGRLVGPAEWDSEEAVKLVETAIAQDDKAADQRVGTGSSPL